MKKKAKSIIGKRSLAMFLAVLMIMTMLPTGGLVTKASSVSAGEYGVVQTVDDPHTLTRPNDIFEEGNGIGSTLNAGKILVGKSVTDGIADGTNLAEYLDLTSELTNMSGGAPKRWTPAEDNFLVTISQSSQMYGITSRIPVPLDVVFVIDTSGSMDESVGGGQDRADAVMAAANSAIKTLLEANDENRVGVVAFSGSDGRDSNYSQSTTVLTSLGHYNTDGDHLTMRDSRLTGKSGSRNARSGGTNIQMGIAAGAKMLMEAQNLTVTYGERTITRIPVLVILSDGAPTFSSSALDWTNPTGGENGRGSSNRGDDPGEGFLAMLTAAYYKNAITQKYYGASATADQRAFVYTIGVGLGSINQNYSGYNAGTTATLANLTMNPSQWLGISIGNDNNQIDNAINTAWENYQSKRDFTIQVGRYSNSSKTYSFKYHATSTQAQYNIDPSVTSLKYNDKYWPADSREEINSAFSEMVIEIQKRAITAPTLTNTTWGQDYSGFVTFTDPIGEYMEIKNVIGVTGEGYLYQGVSLGKLAEGYDPNWENISSTSGEQAAFNAELEQALLDRIHLSTAAGAATPTLEQIRAILNVITYTEADYQANGDPEYNAGGGVVRTFDYDAYGGQLYWNSDADYGNSFTWFGKVHYPDGETEASSGNEDYDVQFIGIAPKNADSIDWLHNGGAEAEALRENAKAAGANCLVRSYFMYGDAGGNRQDETVDMLHFQLRVLTSLEEPHQQYVSIKVPASLLASQKVLIDDTNPNNLEAHYEELIPSRVIYEVGLRSDINSNTVFDIVDEEYLSETLSSGTLANVNADGTVNFYTNDWDRTATEDSHERALAHANFEVSNNNSFYRYEANTPLYTDEQGNNPLTNKPAANGTYYYERTYYTWTVEADGVSTATKHTEMIRVKAPSDPDVIDAECGRNAATGQWYVKAGVYSDETLTAGDDLVKTDNTTGSASVVTHPVHSNIPGDPKYTTWLGNNGKIVFSGLKTKTVVGDDITTTTQKEPAAVIDGKPVMAGDVLTYNLQAVNTEDRVATVTITDTIPNGTTLVAGSITAGTGGTYGVNGNVITWTFTNVAVGDVVNASFKVTVNDERLGTAVTNQGSITVGNNNYSTNATTNHVVGKNAENPDGSDIEDVVLGQPIEYQIAWYNYAETAATITVTDHVPAGTTYVDGSASHSPTLTTVNGKVTVLTWTFSNVEPGVGGVVTFRVEPDATVTPDADGSMDVENSSTISYENGPTITTNEVITPVETGTLTVTKVVTGISVDDSYNPSFEITLTESTGNLAGTYPTSSGTVVFANGVATINLKHNESVTISGLPIGVNISISENDPGAGYTAAYSDPMQTIVSGTPGASVTVTNAYKAEKTDDISTMFTLTKLLTSSLNITRNFGFVAQKYDSVANTVITGDGAETLSVIKTVTSGDANKVTFSFVDKTFSEEGTYYYLVSEQPGNEPELTYDATQYLVKIEVADNRQGKLAATVSTMSRANATEAWPASWTNDTELDFVNHFKPEDISVTLVGTKKLTGRDLIAGEFTFVAAETSTHTGRVPVVRYGHHDADGNITFDPIYYSEIGTYTYNVIELSTTGQDNMTFDTTTKVVTVEVTADANGDLSASVTYPDNKSGVEFGNTYTTQNVYVSLTAAKTLNGRPQLGGEFGFGVFDAEGNEVSSGRVTAAETASGTAADIIFSNITYSLKSFTDAAIVDNEGNKTETFTYTIREYVPTVGADPHLTYDKSEFRFTVTLKYNASTGELSATNHADYMQTHDGAGNALATPAAGAVAFVNKYTPDPVYVTPDNFNKTVTGTNVPDGLTFGFRVIKAALATNAGGAVESVPVSGGGLDYVIDDNDRYAVGDVVGTGISGATAAGQTTTAISFSQLTFYQPGIYKAWIVENNAGAISHGVTHDASKYLMVITVTHNEGTGKLEPTVAYYSYTSGDKNLPESYTTAIADGTVVSFNNTYAANGSMTITAKKVLENRGGQLPFSFTLTEKGKDNVHSGQINGSGVITFDTLTFDETTGGFDSNNQKTLTYIMKEIPGTESGIDYDKSEYELDVRLTHDGQGSITGEIIAIRRIKDRTGAELGTPEAVDLATGVVFTNVGEIYQGTSVTIPLDKTLTGRDMKAGEFGFSLIHWATNGTPLSAPVVVDSALAGDAASGVSYGMSITRNYGITVADGTKITYRISENPGGLKGVTYDKSVYEFDVVVSDENKDGILDAIDVNEVLGTLRLVVDHQGNTLSAPDASVNKISFANTYKSGAITHTLNAVKKLVGRAMEEGEFVFEVYQTGFIPVGSQTVQSSNELVTTGRNNAGANGAEVEFAFDPITYSVPGTHEYKIVETEGNRKGVDYNPEGVSYVVKVVVADNTTTGSLEVISTTYYPENSSEALTGLPKFTNTYTPERIPVVLDIDKVLTGRDMDVDEFSFTVIQTGYTDGTNVNTDKTQVAVGSNTAASDGVSAVIDFSEIYVGEAGTYTYEVTEDPGSRPGVDYAVEVADRIVVTVVVEKNATTGELSVKTIEYRNSSGTVLADPGFENIYTPDPIGHSFYANKKLDGMPLAADMFDFTATLQQKDAAGNWAALAQPVVITAKNNASGLVSFVSANDAIKAAGEYRWVVTENGGTGPSGGNMIFDQSEFYVYVTVNDNPTTGKLSIGTVTYQKGSEDVAEITFTNTFVPTEKYAELPLSKKNLIGRTPGDGEFTFIVTDVQGTAVAKGTNDTTGAIVFDYDLSADGVQADGIKFSVVGSYFYTITEDTQAGTGYTGANVTFDPAKWTVQFVVTQDTVTGELIVSAPVITAVTGSAAADISQIIFTNTYDPTDVKITLKGHKSLTGRTLQAGEFEFHLVSGDNVIAKGFNDENGVITFESITFTSVTTQNYKIIEVNKGAHGVTYDSDEIPVTITVTDDVAAGKLVASVAINGEVYDEVKVGADAQILFENSYKGLPGMANVEVKKELVGRPLVSGEFEFILTEASGNPSAAVIEGGLNDENGLVEFVITELSEVGRYTFVVTEKAGTDTRIEYSQESFEIYVDVTDPGTGRMHAEVSYENGTIPVFTNTYNPDPIQVTIEGIKQLFGRDQKDGEFSFEVHDSAGNLVSTGTNTANKQIEFTPITLPEVGTYTLKVTEVNNQLPYVSYDTEAKTVVIVVTNENGVLKETIQYPENGLIFVNVYDVPYTPPAPTPEPAPDTGDHSAMILWGAMTGFSSMMAVGAIGLRKFSAKRKDDEEE